MFSMRFGQLIKTVEFKMEGMGVTRLFIPEEKENNPRDKSVMRVSELDGLGGVTQYLNRRTLSKHIIGIFAISPLFVIRPF